MSNIPQMSGMAQVIMAPLTDAELLAAAEVKRNLVLSGSTVKSSANIGTAVAAADRLAEDTVVRLSANQKLAMAHKGFEEVEATWKTTGSWEEVADGSTTVFRYVAPGVESPVDNGTDIVPGQARATNTRGDTDDGLVYSENGTFTETAIVPTVGDGVPGEADLTYLNYNEYRYAANASSSSANDGLVGPLNRAVAAERDTAIIVDNPGRTGGAASDDQNYLSIPGRAIRTSWTHVALLAYIGQIADGTVVKTTLTIDDLSDAGVPVNSLVGDNLTAYQDAIAATGDSADVDTLGELCQIIVTVNNP